MKYALRSIATAVGAMAMQLVSAQDVHVNQLGFNANSAKEAQVVGKGGSHFEVKDAQTGKTVYKGKLSTSKYWDLSGEYLQTADFSKLNKPGNYYIESDGKKSFTFPIVSKGAYEEISLWTLKGFYLWRASCPIEKQYATFKGIDFSRKAGHPDDEVYLHMTLGDENHDTDMPFSSPKGWYDAGDYNKYTVNAGFSNEFFGMAYEMFPSYYQQLNLNIPESGNGVPDILNELKWELDWMLTMQDQYDGGVYNKITSLSFSRFYMPERDLNDRYIVGKSTTSALNFAASMAMAARIYAPYENVFPGFTKKALEAAKRAYAWAEKNPAVEYENPKNVHTGSYSDKRLDDEFQMAAAELLITTKDKHYANRIDLTYDYETPVWHNQESMSIMLLALHSKKVAGLVDTTLINEKFKMLADNICLQAECAGGVAATEFRWGSNGFVATNGVIAGLAYYKWKDAKYMKAAQGCFDYLMGKNPTDYCYVTGFGSKYPMHIHDRRSESDGIAEPIPGYLCGGPNKYNQQDCGSAKYQSSRFPAKCYLDEKCSYSTNEIAINWNAPLVTLIGIMTNR
ncbi:MAG: glycoside hydrolase family 9 protein [Bacteroidales bacterium]|nr:glycoside hydrolase family 9 protein [Candidatus Physcocola equi]